MDGGGREVQRRVALDQHRVDLPAARVGAHRAAGRRLGGVVLAGELLQAAQRRVDLGQQDLAALLGQRAALRFGNVLAELGEGLVEGALRDVRGQQAVELRLHPLQRRLRGHPAQAQARAQVHDLLLDAQRVGPQALQQDAHLRLRAHRHALDQVGHLRLEAAHRAQAHAAVAGEGLELDLLLQLVDEQVQRNPVELAQALALHGTGLLQQLALVGIAPGDAFGAHVAQTIAVAFVAEIGGVLRRVLQNAFPGGVEHRVQALRGGPAGVGSVDVESGEGGEQQRCSRNECWHRSAHGVPFFGHLSSGWILAGLAAGSL